MVRAEQFRACAENSLLQDHTLAGTQGLPFMAKRQRLGRGMLGSLGKSRIGKSSGQLASIGPTSLGVEPLEDRRLLAAAPELVLDINDSIVDSIPFGAKPVEFNGSAYFVADDGQTGPELWRSDGTEAGTSLAVDVIPGPAGAYPVPLATAGDFLFFETRSNTAFNAEDNAFLGEALWRTDGTASGTVKLMDFENPVGASDGVISVLQARGILSSIVALGDELYFTTWTGDSDLQLWKSDGTVAGTTLVKDINPTGSDDVWELTAVGDRIYFVANDGVHGHELWKSDGTESGTMMVKDIVPGSGSSLGITEFQYFFTNRYVPGLHEFNGELYFTPVDAPHGRELWKSDGTEFGTQIVADIDPGPASGLKLGKSFNPYGLPFVDYPKLESAGGLLYFTASDNGGNGSLWKTDGSEAGTGPVLIPDIGQVGVREFAEFDGEIYFTTNDPSQSGTINLGRSDGSSAGTEIFFALEDLRHELLRAAGDRLFLFADSSENQRDIARTCG